MKLLTIRSKFVLPAVLGLAATVSTVFAQDASPALDVLAKDLTQQLAAKKFDDVETHFDKTMATGLPVKKLAYTWDMLTGQVGQFQSVGKATMQEKDGYKIVLVTTNFEQTSLNLKWVFDKDSQVAGFFIVPIE